MTEGPKSWVRASETRRLGPKTRRVYPPTGQYEIFSEIYLKMRETYPLSAPEGTDHSGNVRAQSRLDMVPNLGLREGL